MGPCIWQRRGRGIKKKDQPTGIIDKKTAFGGLARRRKKPDDGLRNEFPRPWSKRMVFGSWGGGGIAMGNSPTNPNPLLAFDFLSLLTNPSLDDSEDGRVVIARQGGRGTTIRGTRKKKRRMYLRHTGLINTRKEVYTA